MSTYCFLPVVYTAVQRRILFNTEAFHVPVYVSKIFLAMARIYQKYMDRKWTYWKIKLEKYRMKSACQI